MFPLRDTRSTNIYPLITQLLIGVNIVVFLLEISAVNTESFISEYALIARDLNFSDVSTLWPLITSQFLHAGFFHLLSNMWFLNIFGDNVEERFGRFFYLFIYLLSGVAGGVLQYSFAPESGIPMLGASAAVAGVLGAYYVFYPNHRIETFVPLGVFFTTMNLPASIVLFFWFVTQLFSGIGSIADVHLGGVAFWAHVGGFILGYLLAKLRNMFGSAEIEEGIVLD